MVDIIEITQVLGLVIGVFAVLTLGLVVYRRNPHSATNYLFALLSTDIVLWGIANYISFSVQSLDAALFWVRFVLFLAVPQAMLFLLLMHTFPRATIALPKKVLWGLFAVGMLTMILTLSPYVFTSVDLVQGQPPHPAPGLGMITFIPVAVGAVILGWFYLIRKSISSKGLERVQARYLLTGVITMFALIISFNFIAVNAFDTTIFIPFGPLFTLPFVSATAYAIIKHRMLEIRWMVVRTLFFSLIAGWFFVIYGILEYIATQYLSFYLLSPLQNVLVSIGSAVLAVIGYRYFYQALEVFTNQLLFKGRYDYRRTLLTLGQSLSGTIDFDRILSLLTKTLRDTVKVDKVLVFIRNGKGKEYVLRSSTLKAARDLRLKASDPIVQHLRHRQGLLVRDELDFFLEREDPRHDAEEIREIKTAFSWLDVALVLPLIVKNELVGAIFLGDKLSGDPFSAEDLELLATLAPQASTAIENARLYRESQEFGQKLEKEVARATKDLRVANDRLAQLDRAKSEFLSIASHQLYTPLTAIKGYLSMVQEGDFGKTASKQRPIMDILRQSSDRLIDLIRNLLDVSRIESGRLELSLESVDLVAMARDLVRELTPNAQRKHLALTFDAPTDVVPNVVADTQRLRQVLLNTLDNAIKYTDEGSVHVQVKQEGNWLVYAVRDTGKGISAKEIEQLFTKFTRVGGSDRYHTEGTGLGLYVARQIARELHGDVWGESAGRSKGATFYVKLPVEGSKDSLQAGTKLTVGIKAAEAGQKPDRVSAESGEG